MNDEDQIAFDSFLEKNWGIKPPKTVKYDENGNEIKPEIVQAKTQEEKIKDMAKSFSSSLNSEASKFVGGIGHRNEERQKEKIQEEKVNTEEKKSDNDINTIKNDNPNQIRNELLNGLGITFDLEDDDDNNNDKE